MKRLTLILIVLIIFITPSVPQIFHKNSGTSRSVGSVGNGKLINAYKLPYKGKNFRYFSPLGYFILGRCYLHSDIYGITLESYKEMETIYPGYTFRIMECSRRKGGRSFPHRTHQNGTSIDFMTPLRKGDKVVKRFDHIGIWRYLMKFDHQGRKRFNKKIEIDFDKTARHILVLEKTARRHGYKIQKVILETNLKDEIFSSAYGAELKNSGIYFVKNLSPRINELHDDHYHIDFVKL